MPERPSAGSEKLMAIDVLDYSGHPCQVQLSRSLARRGHQVRHLHCSDYSSGKGALSVSAGDPAGFSIEQVTLGREFARYKLLSRLSYEVSFGRKLARHLKRHAADLIVLSNVPLLAHAVIALSLRGKVPLVFWQQDVYSHAIKDDATRRLGGLGSVVGVLADWIESAIARTSTVVVAITDAFRPTLSRWGVDGRKIWIIPNWAALEEMPAGEKANHWARLHDLDHRFTVLYSGTLGLKHDPAKLLAIAKWLRTTSPEARMVVASQGSGRDWLEKALEQDGLLDQLILLDYVPYEELPSMLATADVLVTLLEPSAGVFSVPSKTLNYLCAARPVLGIMPAENLAAQIIAGAKAGIIVHPKDPLGASAGLAELLNDPAARQQMGKNARAYAEEYFQIDSITDRFEEAFAYAVGRETARGVAPGFPD